MQSNLSEVCYEHITSDYYWGNYIGFKVIINWETNYFNATKLCSQNGKQFKSWNANDSSKTLINTLYNGIQWRTRNTGVQFTDDEWKHICNGGSYFGISDFYGSYPAQTPCCGGKCLRFGPSDNFGIKPMSNNQKYWDQVDLLSQEKIYQLLTKNIPLPHLKLITEPYAFEEKQEKLTGLFLRRDVDYRTLLSDMEDQYDDQGGNPNPEDLAEEVALLYCQLVVKALINEVQDYSCYDSTFFENLTN